MPAGGSRDSVRHVGHRIDAGAPQPGLKQVNAASLAPAPAPAAADM
jgi:hypothetical protein